MAPSHYEHDDAGRLTAQVAPDDVRTEYEYDGIGRLLEVTDNIPEPDVLEAAYAYDDAGNLTGIAYSNGIEAGYTYDAAYRLDVVTCTDTATQQLVAQFDCDVNALGLRTQIMEAVQQPGGGVDTDLVQYEYDLLGRLTRETRTRGEQAIVDKSYEYDLFGNRKKVINHIGPSEQDATFNELHQLKTDGNLTFDYDDNGNLYEKKQGDTVLTRYEYDFLNRLSKVTHNPGQGNEQWQTYEYDAEGGLTRIERDTGAVKRFVNDHHSVTGYHQALVELDGQSSVLARMVYGLDLVKMSRSGEYYYIYDPLGSTRALTDSDADVTDTYLYDAYGNIIEQDPQPPNGTENAYLFTGDRLDAFTGFYYLRARFYDPASGRFTQLDTFLGSPQDPLSLHRYLYANADPIGNVDPSGNASLGEWGLVMASWATVQAGRFPALITAGRWIGMTATVCLMWRQREEAGWLAGEPMFQYALAEEAGSLAYGAYRAWAAPRVYSILNRLRFRWISRVVNNYWREAQSLFAKGVKGVRLHADMERYVNQVLARWVRRWFGAVAQAEVFVNEVGTVVWIGGGRAPAGAKSVGDLIILRRGVAALKVGDKVGGKIAYALDLKSGQRRSARWFEDQYEVLKRTGVVEEFLDLARGMLGD